MWTIKRTDGTPVQVGAGYLERLRMMMNWQIAAAGYDPDSVNAACRKRDELVRPRPEENEDETNSDDGADSDGGETD